MRDTMIFYRSFYEAIKDLPKENQAEVFCAICEYSMNFKEPKLEGFSKTIFTLIKPQLEANKRKFENGKKGGRKKAKPNQNETKIKPKNNQNETKTVANEECIMYNEEGVMSNVKKEKDKKTKDNLEERKSRFKIKVLSFQKEFETPLLKSFFDYWTEHNDDGWVMKFEKQKTFSTKQRLSTWRKNSSQFDPKEKQPQIITRKKQDLDNLYT